ncbi:MAG: TonB C-terminal domain-containing protein, partial [bacterium]
SVKNQPSIFDPKNPPPTLTETANIGIQVQDTLLLRKLKEQENKRRSVERQYNSLLYEQLRGQINAGPQFDKKLSVAIEIQIELDGSVSAYRIKESSGSKQFDLVVMTGMKAIKFPRLPQELGENPPYIVTIRIQP